MPKKIVTKETVAATSVRAAKSKTQRTALAAEIPTAPRVKSVKHSKATTAPPASAVQAAANAVDTHDLIAKIAYGYWEARGFQDGSPEQDWLRAEQEYLQTA
jgi:hypothetical protein